METKLNIRNELFKRNEISFRLNSEKNPSFEEMKKKISEQVKKPEENIDVYNIKGNFGLKQFNVNAYVYDSKEDLKKAEQKTQKQRKAEIEKAKKAETEEPVKAEEPAKRKEKIEEPAKAEEPVKIEEPAKVEEPAKTEEPAKIE